MLLANRAAFVTGGAGRLGGVIAATLQREGATVVIVDCNETNLQLVAARLSANINSKAFAIHGDCSDAEDVRRLAEEAEKLAGPIDILVNAHGIIPNCSFFSMTVEEWDRAFAINVRGVMLTCQAFARRWVDRKAHGAIVNLSSSASRAARPERMHYAASKAAVNMLTEAMAVDLGPYGIRVNAVAPALVLDEVYTSEQPEQPAYVNFVIRGTPLGRTGSPADIAEAVAFLASDRSTWTTGAILDITGGAHCARRSQAPANWRPPTR